MAGRRPGRVPQSTEMEYAPSLKMRIERCYWTDTINPMDDFDTSFRPAQGMPKIEKKAQNSFLVVELAIRNDGDRPLTPRDPPVFQLKSERGTTFNPSAGGTGGSSSLTSKLALGANMNPGESLKGRAVFDVPKGNYDLLVKLGDLEAGRIRSGPLAWIWVLSPEQP